MPRIVAKGDNLNELSRRFAQARLAGPVFLNSVPKCGTHLMRNIMRMFVPAEQQYYRTFIQIPLLHQNLQAFSTVNPYLSWGHLLFSDDSAIALRNVSHLLLIRDPYDWVLARARFFLSDTFQGNLEHLKGGRASIEEVLNMMIFGIHGKAPTMAEIFTNNAVAWLGTNVTLLRFEELIRHVRELDTSDAETYFAGVLQSCGMGTLPDDWRERVRIGADREQSGTARENLAGGAHGIPDELPETQRKLVDFAAPGLREVLGYGG